jgi:hypothetical protein
LNNAPVLPSTIAMYLAIDGQYELNFQFKSQLWPIARLDSPSRKILSA